MDNVSESTLSETLDYTCPRCQSPVVEVFYGPCDRCRDQLRATMLGEKSDYVAPEYEPKMNVVPNAIASKE